MSVADGSVHFEHSLRSAFRNDTLQLILLPTEKCNFRCTYCYETFERGRMSPAVVEGVKALLGRRLEGLRRLSISWFGGEPLLAMNVIRDISSFVVSRAADAEVEYWGDVTTNAYLLDAATLFELDQLGIRNYQISIDGPQHLHDVTRRRSGGGGSFDRIWSNLQGVKRSDCEVSVVLRVHVTADNVRALDDFLPVLRDTFLDDARFQVLLKPVERLGGPNDDSLNLIDHDEEEGVLRRLEQLVIPSQARGNESELDSAVAQVSNICYASKPNSLLIRSDGKVGKCTVGLDDPNNVVGMLNVDGSISFAQERLRAWFEGWTSGDQEKLRCPYAYMEPSREPVLVQIGRASF